MKKKVFYMLASVLFILSACNVNMDPVNDQDDAVSSKIRTEHIQVFTENDSNVSTKVSLDSQNKYGWTARDTMSFFITNDGGTTYVKEVSAPYNTSTKRFDLTYDASYTRGGFAVVPASFAKTYEGGTLTVTYPSSYDISADIAADRYDNAGTFIPMPMVAKNETSTMTFYSIGALVKVVMSNIPAGTKNLFVTFNQTVTGDFAVTNPGSMTPSIAVADASASSTVSIKVSDAGLTDVQAANPITLYIPVPTTTNLKIASSTVNKASVLRNKGYAFAVNAITCTGDGSIATTEGSFIVAPGNLWAQGKGGSLVFSFGHPLTSTMGSKTDDPHVEAASPVPDLSKDLSTLKSGSNYQDVFTWPQLCTIFSDGVVPSLTEHLELVTSAPNGQYHFPTLTKLTIDGKQWTVSSSELMFSLFDQEVASGNKDAFPDSYRRTGSKAIVGTNMSVVSARAIVDVDGTAYESYSPNTKQIPGVFLFPDNYIDQTDAIQLVNIESRDTPWKNDDANRSSLIISLSAFNKMVEAGAIFLPAVGYYPVQSTVEQWYLTCTTLGNESVRLIQNGAYIHTTSGEVCFRGVNLGPSANSYVLGAARLVTDAACVRLVREVAGQNASSSGETRNGWNNVD